MTKNDRFFDRIALEVSQGLSVRDACELAGCSEATGYRISNDPRFALRVSELRTSATDAAIGRLSSAASNAVEVLRSIMADGESDPKDRIASAKIILSLLLPMTELGELRGRLDKLEQREMR
jgi:hypothetical protein